MASKLKIDIFLRIIILIFMVFACTKPPSMESSTPEVESAQSPGGTTSKKESTPLPPISVKGIMQKYPGGPLEEVEVTVHEVPVDPLSVAASEISLNDDDLVLGVEINGQAMAYPIRYLALFEIVDDRVGDTPLAPTW